MAKKKKRPYRVWGLLLIVFLLSGFLFLQFIEKVGKLNQPSKVRRASREIAKIPVLSAPAVIPKDKIAILIDDLGPSLKEFHQLKKLHPNLSFAVLPFQTFSIKIAKEVHFGHHDLLLHLPMEAENHDEKPGKGAIYHSMNPKEIARQTRLDIEAIPDIQGVNNHMGSKITSDGEEMRVILNEIKSRQLYFVDSRTTSSSVAFSLAEEMGMKSAERQVFLDDTGQFQDIMRELHRLADIAHQKGAAIAIGHPRPDTIRALEGFLPRLEKENLELVPISTLVR